ncbi:MAG: polysulfide reductase NrfD [Melioribacteraceae bacterium]|nr:polysulfide reductase NrfD [Melioribacteraceae bacterium]
MHEITITRHNHLIDPSLHIWGWEIPVYLFLGGMVAGMLVISGYFLFTGRHKSANCSCFYMPIMSFILLSLGMLALFLDLEHKLYVWRLFTTFEITSPMSWGSWILVLLYPLILVNMILRPPEILVAKFPKIQELSTKMNDNVKLLKNIGVLNMLLGGSLGLYTGVLLSSLGARPLWSSSVLWLLFLTSGLSAAAAFIHMVAKEKFERELLAKADNGFLVFELFVFAMLFVGLATSSRAHADAAMILINGPYAAVFWVFVIALGLVIPLIIQLLAVNHKIKHTPVAPIMVIIGGLILRFVIVSAGQYSHWLH